MNFSDTLQQLAEMSEDVPVHPTARAFFLTHARQIFGDPVSLSWCLAGRDDHACVLSIAINALEAADLDGSRQDRELFLRAILHFAPVQSPEYARAKSRMQSL